MYKKMIIALSLIVLFSAAYIFGLSKSNTQLPIDLSPTEDTQIQQAGSRGWVCRDIKTPDGTVVSHECKENTFTENGVNITASRLFLGETGGAFIYIIAGNGSEPSSTDTSLPGEITDACLNPQGRQDFSGNCGWSSNANLTCWYQWETECTMIVNSTGTGNATSGGIFLQGASFTDASMQQDWFINISITREFTTA